MFDTKFSRSYLNIAGRCPLCLTGSSTLRTLPFAFDALTNAAAALPKAPKLLSIRLITRCRQGFSP